MEPRLCYLLHRPPGLGGRGIGTDSVAKITGPPTACSADRRHAPRVSTSASATDVKACLQSRVASLQAFWTAGSCWTSRAREPRAASWASFDLVMYFMMVSFREHRSGTPGATRWTLCADLVFGKGSFLV